MNLTLIEVTKFLWFGVQIVVCFVPCKIILVIKDEICYFKSQDGTCDKALATFIFFIEYSSEMHMVEFYIPRHFKHLPYKTDRVRKLESHAIILRNRRSTISNDSNKC